MSNTFFKKQKSNFLVVGIVAVSSLIAMSTLTMTPTFAAFAGAAVNSPTKATIVSYPTKSTYLTGETFDPTGLSLEVSCTNGSTFLLEYNADTADKFLLPTEALTKSDTNVSISYASPNGTVEVSIPVSVDYYRIDTVDLYVNSENRVMWQIGGAYGEGYQDNVEEAEFYIVPHGDRFKFASTNPITTPASFGATYGTFTAEVDVTDITSCNIGLDANSAYQLRYWPHFVMKNEEGVAEDKDLRFPALERKEVRFDGLEEDLRYVLSVYVSATSNKYIPIVTLFGDDVGLTYHFDANDATYTLPDTITQGYMPMWCDVEIVNDRVLWSVTARYRGYKTVRQLERALAFGLNGYVQSSSSLIWSKEFGYACLYDYDYYLEINETDSTFKFSLDITDLSVNYKTSGKYLSYYLRFGGNTADKNDAKCYGGVNHNKAVTLGEKTYTVSNTSTPDKFNAWGCLGFKITPNS